MFLIVLAVLSLFVLKDCSDLQTGYREIKDITFL